MALSSRKVTLLSNSSSSVYQKNAPANFVNDLPIPIAEEGRNWRVSLDRLSFQPVFANIPLFEPHCPHFVYWYCDKFTLEDENKFPTERNLKFWYNVCEERLEGNEAYEDIEDLTRKLNEIFLQTTVTDSGITFSKGKRGIKISGVGNSVLLISLEVAKWMRLYQTAGDTVQYGNGIYVYLNFSNGEASSVEGFRNETLFTSQAPTIIKVFASFDVGGWVSHCLAILPYYTKCSTDAPTDTDSNNPICHSSSKFYYHNRSDVKEYMPLSANTNFRRVKITMTDEKNKPIRLAQNHGPSIVSLTIKGSAPKMNTFVVRAQGGFIEGTRRPENKFRVYFEPPLRNYNGKWQVTLQSIFFPVAMQVIEDQDSDTELLFTFPDGRTLTLPPIRSELFTSAIDLVTHLTQSVANITGNKVQITLNNANRINFAVADGMQITMKKKLAIILGLVEAASVSSSPFIITSTLSGLDKVDVSRLLPPCIAVHCSIAQPSIVGSSLTDILEMVPTHLRSGGDGSRLAVYESVRLNYIDVKIDHIANFEISLKTMSGDALKFNECDDKVLVSLLFREKIKN